MPKFNVAAVVLQHMFRFIFTYSVLPFLLIFFCSMSLVYSPLSNSAMLELQLLLLEIDALQCMHI